MVSKTITITFVGGKTRTIGQVKSHEYMSTSETLKVVTEGRTYYHPLRNLLEIEVAYYPERVA